MKRNETTKKLFLKNGYCYTIIQETEPSIKGFYAFIDKKGERREYNPEQISHIEEVNK
jgi:hypothetical protein